MITHTLFVYFIVFCLLAFVLPKAIYMAIETNGKHGGYHIMPQFGGPLSNSSIQWIECHWTIAWFFVAQLCLALHTAFDEKDEKEAKKILKRFDRNPVPWFMHYLFVASVLYNAKNLGGLDEEYSKLVNVVICAILCGLKFYWTNRRVLAAYISILSIPLYLDFLMFLYSCYAMVVSYMGSGIPPDKFFFFNLVWVLSSIALSALMYSFVENISREDPKGE